MYVVFQMIYTYYGASLEGVDEASLIFIKYRVSTALIIQKVNKS